MPGHQALIINLMPCPVQIGQRYHKHCQGLLAKRGQKILLLDTRGYVKLIIKAVYLVEDTVTVAVADDEIFFT